MPGRTPAEAVDAFLDPLRDALRVLDGVAKLMISPRGGFRKDVRYSWVLNGADGALAPRRPQPDHHAPPPSAAEPEVALADRPPDPRECRGLVYRVGGGRDQRQCHAGA
jgi:hypothetical protein